MDYRSKERHRPPWQNRNNEEWGRDEEEADAKTHARGGHDHASGHTSLSLAPRLQPQDCSPKTAKTLGFDVPASLLARVGRVTE